MLLHAKDASQSDIKKALIRTVHTDVVAISIGLFGHLDLLELWSANRTGGKHLRYLEIHKITAALDPEKSKCLPLFHAFTGCCQVAFFAGIGKKTAWNTWNHFSELTNSFSSMSLLPKLEDITNHSASIERFAVLLYDRISTISTVNECRKDLFAKKAWLLEARCPHAAFEKSTVPTKLLLGSVIGRKPLSVEMEKS